MQKGWLAPPFLCLCGARLRATGIGLRVRVVRLGLVRRQFDDLVRSEPRPVTTATSFPVIEKIMTLSAGEFAKSLCAFAGGDVAFVDGRARLGVGDEGGVAEIAYAPLPPRRVGGLLELPQARVTITLTGVSPSAAQAFLRRFDIAFQRGGG